MLIEKIINNFNAEFYDKVKSNGKGKNKGKNKKSNSHNVKKGGNGKNKKNKKLSRDKNGNLFYYNCNKYGYIVKQYFKPPKKRKNSDNSG